MTTTTTAATKGGGDVRFEDLGGEPQLKPSPPMGSTTMADPKQGRSSKDFEHCELFSRKKCSHQQPKNRSIEKLLPGPPVRFATHTQLQKNLLIRNAYWIKIKIVSLPSSFYIYWRQQNKTTKITLTHYSTYLHPTASFPFYLSAGSSSV